METGGEMRSSHLIVRELEYFFKACNGAPLHLNVKRAGRSRTPTSSRVWLQGASLARTLKSVSDEQLTTGTCETSASTFLI